MSTEGSSRAPLCVADAAILAHSVKRNELPAERNQLRRCSAVSVQQFRSSWAAEEIRAQSWLETIPRKTPATPPLAARSARRRPTNDPAGARSMSERGRAGPSWLARHCRRRAAGAVGDPIWGRAARVLGGSSDLSQGPGGTASGRAARSGLGRQSSLWGRGARGRAEAGWGTARGAVGRFGARPCPLGPLGSHVFQVELPEGAR